MQLVINAIAINLILIFIIQLILSITIVKTEESGFWSVGRVFSTKLILLPFINTYKDNKPLTRLINIYRGLLIILTGNVIMLFYLVNNIG